MVFVSELYCGLYTFLKHSFSFFQDSSWIFKRRAILRISGDNILFPFSSVEVVGEVSRISINLSDFMMDYITPIVSEF